MYNNELNKSMKDRKKKASKSVPGGFVESTNQQYSGPNSNYFINRMQTITPYPQGNDTMRIVNQQLNGVPSRMIYNSNFGNPRVQVDQNGQSNIYTDPNMVNMYRNQISGFYANGGDISIPNLNTWLSKYDVGGENYPIPESQYDMMSNVTVYGKAKPKKVEEKKTEPTTLPEVVVTSKRTKPITVTVNTPKSFVQSVNPNYFKNKKSVDSNRFMQTMSANAEGLPSFNINPPQTKTNVPSPYYQQPYDVPLISAGLKRTAGNNLGQMMAQQAMLNLSRDIVDNDTYLSMLEQTDPERAYLLKMMNRNPFENKFFNGGFLMPAQEGGNINFPKERGYTPERMAIGGKTGDPNKPYNAKTNPTGYVSMKNNKDWFDNHANWSNTGNAKYDTKVRQQVMTGRFGVDPNSGALIKLPQSEWTNVSEEDKRLATDKRQWTSGQKQTSWEKQVKPQIVQSTKDLITNPVMMAPGAILTGGMASGIPAVSRTLGAIAPALNTPIAGIAGATPSNLLASGFAADALVNRLPQVPGQISKGDYAGAAENIITGGLDLAGANMVSPIYKGASNLVSEGKNLYNTVATGESVLPIAWKSPAVGLSEKASQNMFKNVLNNANLTDAERAVVADYQFNSRLYTGRNGNVDPVKREAINNIIKKYNINVGDDAIATRMFNPENNSLGATLENGKLNFGDRPTSFTVGAKGSWGSGATDRLVIPNRYLKKMEGNFVKNTYEPLSEEALKLVPENSREFAAGIGRDNTRLGQERELIGSGLDLKRIGKVKNDVGGYDWIVKPKSNSKYGSLSNAETSNPQQFSNLRNSVNSGNYLTTEAKLSDDVVEGLMKSTNTITGKGNQILNDLSSSEGMRRLKNQFKLANPGLNEQQLDHLVVTRLNEVNDAVNFNQPKFMLTHGRGAPGSPTEGMLERFYPKDNAHWSHYNPYPNVQSIEAPQSLFPKANTSGQNASGINLQKQTGYEVFTDPNYSPGSITLGKNLENNVMVLDHEIGHAIQKGGVMPVDSQLQELIRSKNPFDNIFQKKLNLESQNDRWYFRTAGGRSHKNESYPFLVEQRRKMIERGILNNRYDKVTPLKLFQARLAARNNTGRNFMEGDRLIKFTPFWKYGKLSKIMNNAPAVVPAVGGAALMAGDGNEETNSQQKYGGESWLSKYPTGGPIQSSTPTLAPTSQTSSPVQHGPTFSNQTGYMPPEDRREKRKDFLLDVLKLGTFVAGVTDNSKPQQQNTQQKINLDVDGNGKPLTEEQKLQRSATWNYNPNMEAQKIKDPFGTSDQNPYPNFSQNMGMNMARRGGDVSIYGRRNYKSDTPFFFEKGGTNWLNKYNVGGGPGDGDPTLLKDKKVGEIISPISNLNLRPVFPSTTYEDKYIYDPNCPDPTGVGCSYQATREAMKITGLPLQSYAPANAAFRDAVAQREGLQNIFNQEGEQKKYANSGNEGWKYPNEEDFSKWRAGDIVVLDAPGVDYFGYDAPPGFTEADNSGASHNGVVVGFTKEGRPIIRHGYSTGEKGKGKQITEVLGGDNRVTSLGHGRYAVKSIWRPKEVTEKGDVVSIVPIVDKGVDQGLRKQASYLPAAFSLKTTEEEKLMNRLPVAGAFSGANTRLSTKNNLVNLFNDEKLDKELQFQLGINSETLQNLKPVVYGIAGQETNFNDVNSPFVASKDVMGNMLNMGNSKGLFQIKYDSLTEEERKLLGIESPKDLLDDKKAYKAAILMMHNAKNRMDAEVEEGTHPGLKNANPYFRAAYYYNSPGRAVSTAEQWARGNNPVVPYDPSTWLNPLSTRERPGVFASINPNYVEQIQLRMDKGSYPYKLMEKAYDLNMENRSLGDSSYESEIMEPIVVRSAKKGKKIKMYNND